jgi:Sec-independent protein translocase protein TatA
MRETSCLIPCGFPVLPEMSNVLKRLDDIGQTLARLAGELKQCVEDVRVVSARQLERLEQERASAILAASVDAQVDAEQVSLQNVEDSEAKKVGRRAAGCAAEEISGKVKVKEVQFALAQFINYLMCESWLE